MADLDPMDRAILQILQKDFSVTVQPYLEIAHKLGTTEEEVMARITALKNRGLIRRIGGVFDSRKMGYYSTLCAMQVPPQRIQTTAEAISKIEGVTHNYLRDNEWNMWFTLTAQSKEEADKILSELEATAGIPVFAMPAKKTYKINVSFDVEVPHEV